MAGRIVDIIFKVDTRQFDAAMSRAVGMTRKLEKETAQAARGLNYMERSMRSSSVRMKAIGSSMQSVGRGMTYVGAGMVALGYESIKSAMNFQTAMVRIQTQAGLGAKQVDAMSAAVLKLGQSGAVQYGPTELANALFHIESVATGTYGSLRNTSNAMNALKIAAQGAALGGSDLEQTTTALMGVMFATRAPLSQMANIMGLINATVGAGNLRMGDLVQALGRGVIPAFRQVGLTSTDAFAAIALLSDSGVKASSAAAQLGTALHFLVKPSTEADKFLGAIHMSSVQMAADLHQPKGLLVALQDLAGHLQTLPGGLMGVAAGQVTSSLLPGGRGRILLTLLQNLDQYKSKIDAIYGTQGNFNKLVQAQQQTLGGQLHTAFAKVNADFTKFGQTLTPLVTQFLPPFLKGIEAILGFFTRMPGPMKTVLGGLAAFFVLGGPVLLGLGKFVSLWAKFRDIVIALKVAGLWKTLALGTEAATAATVAGGSAGVGGAAVGAGTATAASSRLAGRLGSILRWAGPVGAVVATGMLLEPYLKARKNAPPAGTGPIFGNPRFRGATGGMVTPYGISHMQAGGPIGSDTIPAWLSVGEGVLNRTAMAQLGAGGLGAMNNGQFPLAGSDQPIIIYNYLTLDGRVAAKSTTRAVINKAARGPSSLVGGALNASR